MTMTTKHMPTITYQASAAVSTFRLPTYDGFVVTVNDGQLATIEDIEVITVTPTSCSV